MMEWLKRHRGWITLIVLAAIYYPMFGKGYQAIALYAATGRCIWNGQALLPCQPMYSYQPALAALLLPFAVVPAALQKLVWYVICVGSLVLTVRLAETMAERLYPGATRGRNLIWLRSVSLFLCSKHIMDVLNYQAYEAPALAMVMLGICALTVGREALGGFWLGAAAAIRADR
jgi:glycosyl transferase family 87